MSAFYSPSIDRREALMVLAATIAASGVTGTLAATRFDLVYSSGRLSWPGGSTRASIGLGGVRSNKREGDLATPQGDFRLLEGFYRPDRISPAPRSTLPLRPLHPNYAWVDDPNDSRYNNLVHIPYRAHIEHLWRSDGIYDIVIVIGYNTTPPRPGAGSAIFLHLSRKNYSPTVGCISIDRQAMLILLPKLSVESYIHIH